MTYKHDVDMMFTFVDMLFTFLCTILARWFCMKRP